MSNVDVTAFLETLSTELEESAAEIKEELLSWTEGAELDEEERERTIAALLEVAALGARARAIATRIDEA